MIHGIGKVCADYLYSVDSYPQENSLEYINKKNFAVGGMVANALKVLSGFGQESRLCSFLGRDDVGEELIHRLNDNGNVDSGGITFQGSTDFSTVILSGGNRTIFHYKDKLPRTLNPGAFCFQEGDVVLTDCTITEGLYDVLKAARRASAQTVMDVGSGNIDLSLISFLPYIDYCIPSYEWASRFCGTEDRDQIAAELLDRGVGHLIITDGARSIWLYDRSGKKEFVPPDFEVRNSNGAGDTFHGAFCYMIARSPDVEDAIRFAMYAASYKCFFGEIELIPEAGVIEKESKEIE